MSTPESQLNQVEDIPTFAKRLRAKAGEAYPDLDDTALVSKFLRKNPVYVDRVKLPDSFKLLTTSTGHTNLDDLYEKAGREANVDPNLLIEQGRQETINFHPDVVYGRKDSPAGAKGAGQFMPGTAREFGLQVGNGIDERTDPVKSVSAQARMMRGLLDRHNGDTRAALAGYNSGHNLSTEAALRNAQRIPETRGYVDRIFGTYSKLSDPALSVTTPAPTPPNTPGEAVGATPTTPAGLVSPTTTAQPPPYVAPRQVIQPRMVVPNAQEARAQLDELRSPQTRTAQPGHQVVRRLVPRTSVTSTADTPVQLNAQPNQSTPAQPSGQTPNAVRVNVSRDATPESVALEAFKNFALANKVRPELADAYARESVDAVKKQRGEKFFGDNEAAFLSSAKRSGAASVQITGPALDVLDRYLGGQESGRHIETQMSLETGVEQPGVKEALGSTKAAYWRSLGFDREPQSAEEVNANKTLSRSTKDFLLSHAEQDNQGNVRFDTANLPNYQTFVGQGLEDERRGAEQEDLAKSLTPEDRAEVSRRAKALTETNAVTRSTVAPLLNSVAAGGEDVLGGIYKVAEDVVNSTGLDGQDNSISDYFKKHAYMTRAVVAEADAASPLSKPQKALAFGSDLLGNVALLAAASELGGAKAAFGGTGFFGSLGRGESYDKATVEGIKGLALEKVYSASETLPLAQRGPTIAAATYGIERATGSSEEQAIHAALTNAGFVAAHPAGEAVGRAAKFLSGPREAIQNQIEGQLRANNQPTSEATSPASYDPLSIAQELRRRAQTQEAAPTEMPAPRPVVSRPVETQAGPRAASMSDTDLATRIEQLAQRPTKGTPTARREANQVELNTLLAEASRRFARTAQRPVENEPLPSDVPSFREFVEEMQPRGGIRFDTLSPDEPLYAQLKAEYDRRYGAQSPPVEPDTPQTVSTPSPVSEGQGAQEAAPTGAVRHVDVQARRQRTTANGREGQFRKETKVEAETRRAQVGSPQIPEEVDATQNSVGSALGSRAGVEARRGGPQGLADNNLAGTSAVADRVVDTAAAPRSVGVDGGQTVVAAPDRLNAPIPDATAFRSHMKDKFNLSDEQADAVTAIADARANAWAKENGRDPSDYYAARFGGIVRGGEVGPGALHQASNEAPTFYSQLRKVIEEKMPARMKASDLRRMVTDPQKGIKAEELKWTGLDDYLRDKAAKNEAVTKEDVRKFLAENEVKVEEVVKGRDVSGLKIRDRGAGLYDIVDADGHKVKSNLMRDDAERFIKSQGGETKFSQYTLPGAKEGSYRELLLTLPVDSPNIRRREELTRLYKSGEMTPEQRAEWERLSKPKVLLEESERVYISSHFDEPNVLAHIRFNERTDAEGKRVLFVEEIQSDWHQAGRKTGYIERPVKSTYSVLDKGHNNFAVVNEKGDEIVVAGSREYAERTANEYNANGLPAHLRDGRDTNQARVPDAPFKKNWHELAMKRVLRYAAENGYDRVAWTKGETQAARYDLSKHVDDLHYVKEKDGTYSFDAEKNGVTNFFKNNIPESEIESYVGKEIAEKMLKGEGVPRRGRDIQKGARTLRGLDLKVGGEGMKGFYDRILPSFAAKYGRKWGARVGETEIPTAKVKSKEERQALVTPEVLRRAAALAAADGHKDYARSLREEASKVEAGKPLFYSYAEPGMAVAEYVGRVVDFNGTTTERAHSIDISPSMKKSAMEEGQPLFQSNKAAVEFMQDGRAIIRAFKEADVSSAWHEMAHVFRRDLSPNLLKDAEESLGVKDGNWTPRHDEQFARGFERYLKTGEAPTVKLRRVFEAAKQWLTEIYGAVRGKDHPLKFKPNEQLTAVFDRMLGGEPKGDYGQLIHNLHKAPDEGTPPFFENAQVKRAAGLRADASTADVRAAITEQVGKPRSSHLSPDDVIRWADSKGLRGDARKALDFGVSKYRETVRAPTQYEQTGTRKRNADPATQSLSEFVRASGGLRVDRDLANKGELSAFTNKESGTSGLVRKDGKSVEQMAQAAADAGYPVGEGGSYTKGRSLMGENAGSDYAHPDTFLEMLNADLGGDSVYSSEREYDYEEMYRKAHPEDNTDALDSLLATENGATLYDKVSDGTATGREIQEFKQVAREHGVFPEHVSALIKQGKGAKAAGVQGASAGEGRPGGSARRGSDVEFNPQDYERDPDILFQSSHKPQQLGFVNEGLTQESARRDQPKPQFDDARTEAAKKALGAEDYAKLSELKSSPVARIASEVERRISQSNAENAPDILKALSTLAELKRTKQTVSDYLNQGSLFGERELSRRQEQILSRLDANPRKVLDEMFPATPKPAQDMLFQSDHTAAQRRQRAYKALLREKQPDLFDEMGRVKPKLRKNSSAVEVAAATVRAFLLSNPATPIKAIIGLTTKRAYEQASKPLAVAFDAMFSKMAGTNRATAGLSIGAISEGLKRAGREGIPDAWRILKGEQPQVPGQHSFPGIRTRVPAYDAAINTVQRVYGAKAALFYTDAFYNEVAGQAKLQARREARTGKIPREQIEQRARQLINNPSPEIQRIAVDVATRNVYMNENLFSDITKAGKNFLRKNIPGGHLAGTLAIPIDRVPSNAAIDLIFSVPVVGHAKAALQYAKAIENLREAVRETDPKAAEDLRHAARLAQNSASTTTAKATMSTLFLLTGAYLAAKGDVDDKRARIPGTNLWANLAPLGLPGLLTAMGGEIYRRTHAEGDKQESLVGATAEATKEALKEVPIIRGAVNAVDTSRRRGAGAGFSEAAANLLVPQGVQAASSLTDDKKRKPSGFLQSLEARIPFARRHVPEDDAKPEPNPHRLYDPFNISGWHRGGNSGGGRPAVSRPSTSRKSEGREAKPRPTLTPNNR